MIKAIVFDVGDVLLEVGKSDIKDIAVLLGVNDLEKVKKVWNELKLEFQRGEIREKKFLQCIAKKLGVKLKKWKSQLEERFSQRVKRREDVFALAKELAEKGYKIAILSNTIKPHVKHMRKMRYFEAFPLVIFSCEVGMRKPEPRIFRYLLKKLKVKAEECIFHRQ
jgi:putative hydrolase of the HAD superfamily